MSPAFITALVFGALFVAIILIYISQQMERRKLERQRQKAELTERVRRCADLNEILPGQMMTPQLKLLMYKIELKLSERLRPLAPENTELVNRIDELVVLLGKGENVPVKNLPQSINTEHKAKEIRFLLEGLHGVITRAAREHLITTAEARHWVEEIRHMMVQLHIDFFTSIGQQLLQQEKPRQARLAFERAVQFLRRQADQERYRLQLRDLARYLERANDLALEREPTEDDHDELTAGLTQEEIDDPWRKKQVYD